MKILVTGAGGQLASEFKDISGNTNHVWTFVKRSDCDITDSQSLTKLITKNNPECIINCAAYTAVDKAESEEEMAFKVNAEAVKLLAEVCKKESIKLIHYSTDYVYHNDVGDPLRESDLVNPRGVYAKSKLQGEEYIAESQADYLIFRTSWVYSSHGHNFVKTMLRLFETKEELRIVDDQIGAPTYAKDIALTTLDILDKTSGMQDSGIYNMSNSGFCSWYEFAKEIKSHTSTDCTLIAIPSSEYPTPAERPLWSVLNNSKRQAQFGQASLRHWKDALSECLAMCEKPD